MSSAMPAWRRLPPASRLVSFRAMSSSSSSVWGGFAGSSPASANSFLFQNRESDRTAVGTA